MLIYLRLGYKNLQFAVLNLAIKTSPALPFMYTRFSASLSSYVTLHS